MKGFTWIVFVLMVFLVSSCVDAEKQEARLEVYAEFREGFLKAFSHAADACAEHHASGKSLSSLSRYGFEGTQNYQTIRIKNPSDRTEAIGAKIDGSDCVVWADIRTRQYANVLYSAHVGQYFAHGFKPILIRGHDGFERGGMQYRLRGKATGNEQSGFTLASFSVTQL